VVDALANIHRQSPLQEQAPAPEAMLSPA